MKIQGEEVPSGAVRTYDVCVIGSGAAGITIARELIHSKLKVALLEAGEMEWSEEGADSYNASKVTAQPQEAMDDSFPGWSRLRYFGGSTNHWGGWCRPFDEIDFEKRDWIANSGWPITRRDLHPYYAKAADYVQMQKFDLDAESRDAGVHGVLTRSFHYSPPTKFGEVYGPELFAASNIEVVLNAPVVRFDTNQSGAVVESVQVKNAKTEFTVKAKTFVLACGGLENPRLLLNSDHQQKNGLGNSSDMVGRCFTEHPHASIGLVMNTEDPSWHAPFTGTKGNDPMAIFATSSEFQKNSGTMNFSCELQIKKSGNLDSSEALGLTSFTYGKDKALTFLNLYTRSEMLPSKANRVFLSNDRDKLGMRRINLDIQFGRDDLRSVVKSTEAVIRMLSAKGLGRGRISLESEDLWSTDLGPGCHHMGTTRMSATAKEGVVDQNCRVHDLNNLYIAGSSVFSTGGYANPTLTIVALALRLTDYIRSHVGGAA